MPDGAHDFAVFGSTAFARLLAGQLAGVHGKRVCLVGDRWSPYRLPRRFDLSVPVATRPETWALLGREIPETLKLLASLGRGLFERVDPLFIAETPESIAAVGHMRWMALGFGFAAERAIDRVLTETGEICRFRDAAILVPSKVEPAIAAWLESLSVSCVAQGDVALNLRRDGPSTLTIGDRPIPVGTVILADDDAILGRLPPSDRHRLLAVRDVTALALDPAALRAPFASYLDRDVMVFQRSPRSPVSAIATGDRHSATSRIAASVNTPDALRGGGQSVFQTIATLDGAPLVGPMGRNRAIVAAGLGPVAAFLAPAMARWLTGADGDETAAYFQARAPSRGVARAEVVDWTPSIAAGPVP